MSYSCAVAGFDSYSRPLPDNKIRDEISCKVGRLSDFGKKKLKEVSIRHRVLPYTHLIAYSQARHPHKMSHWPIGSLRDEPVSRKGQFSSMGDIIWLCFPYYVNKSSALSGLSSMMECPLPHTKKIQLSRQNISEDVVESSYL